MMDIWHNFEVQHLMFEAKSDLCEHMISVYYNRQHFVRSIKLSLRTLLDSSLIRTKILLDFQFPNKTFKNLSNISLNLFFIYKRVEQTF